MASVYLNYSSISSSVINSLSSAISYLDTVIGYLQRNSIPSDFARYSTLVNTISDLKKQRDKLSNFSDWLVNSNKNYDSFILNLEKQALKLPVCHIKKRTSIVRDI